MNPAIALAVRAAPSEDALIAAVQILSAAGVSALCFLVWDTIIHFADEVELIWKAPNTWSKYMYFFIRYFSIFVQASLLAPVITNGATSQHFSDRGCRRWLRYQAGAVETVTLSVEIVLMVRVYALYNRNKVMLWALIVLFLGEIATMFAVLLISVPRLQHNPQCLVTAAPRLYMGYWLSSLAFETVLFAFTLVSLYSSVRRGLGEHSVTYVFMRDGTWAFALIFLIMLLNTLMYQLNESAFAGIFFCWALSIMPFSGAHILLNLRRVSTRGSSAFAFSRPLHFRSDTYSEEEGADSCLHGGSEPTADVLALKDIVMAEECAPADGKKNDQC